MRRHYSYPLFHAIGLSLLLLAANVVMAQTGGSGGAAGGVGTATGGAATGGAATGGAATGGAATGAAVTGAGGAATGAGATTGANAAAGAGTQPGTMIGAPNAAPQTGANQAGSSSVGANGQLNPLNPATPNANGQTTVPGQTGVTGQPGAATNAQTNIPAPGATATPGAGANVNAGGNASSPAGVGVGNSYQPLGFSLRTGSTGLRIDSLNSGGYAESSGLQANDEVVSLNGQNVRNQAEFSRQMDLARTRSTPLMLGVRRNGQLRMVQMNANGPATANPTAGISGFGQGLTFAPAGNAAGVVNAAGTEAAAQNGMLVSQVAPNSWAENAGLMANDRITAINGRPLDTMFGFDAQLQTALAGNAWADVTVNRNGQTMPLRIAAPGGAEFRPTGNFNDDFQTWAGNWASTMGQVRRHYQGQINQLNRLNEQINSLRSSTLSSTGQSFDVARNAERYRALQSDIEALSRQTNGNFQNQLNALHRQLEQLNPAAGGAAAGAAGAGGTNAAADANPGGINAAGTTTPNAGTNQPTGPR